MIPTKTKTLLLLSSIALLTTPAFARTSQEALHISNGRVETTDISAQRRHHAKQRHAKARYAKARYAKVRKARHVSARSVKSRYAKRYQASRRHMVRNVRPQMVGQVAGYNAYASIPDQHSIGGLYQYSAVQPFRTSAYYAVAPGQPETPRRRPMARREARTHHTGWGGGSVVAEARRYIGTNPTRYSRLWCAHFMNMVLERTGYRGTGSGFARSFASYGTRVSGPQVGAIAVMSRGRGGGHVGVVSGIDANGNPVIISGNHGRRVAEAVYPRGRIYAYVMP